jgi:adenosine deaminase
MWISIEQLGAVRIGHGIAAAQDPRLLATLVERGIVLEVCPTSNLRTAVVASIEDHPFPVLRDAGVRLTLNTDDPGMFDTDLNREYVLAHDVFGVDRSGLVELAREAVRASLAPATAKARLLAEIDDYAGTALPELGLTTWRCARRAMTRAMTQPMIVQPSSRLTQKTDQWRTSRMAATAQGAM